MKSRIVVLLILVAIPAHAQTPPAHQPDSRVHRATRVVVNEARRYVSDATSMLLAPGSWNPEQWQRAGVSVGSIAGAFTIDDEARRVMQNNRNDATQNFADFVTPFGGRRAEYVAIALLATGFGIHDETLRETGRDALEATILAGRIATPIVKEVAGRSRPFEEEGSLAFDPFSGNKSFPSGHATNAFAVASVVAAHYGGWKIPTLAYTLATSVAFARVHDDVHWTSDVLTGAIVGTSIGRGIVARHRPAPTGAISRELTVTPFVVRDGGGFMVGFPLTRFVR